jgi:hypothetical protein
VVRPQAIDQDDNDVGPERRMGSLLSSTGKKKQASASKHGEENQKAAVGALFLTAPKTSSCCQFSSLSSELSAIVPS